MTDINYQYLMMRNMFGKQPMFCEQGPVMCDNITTNPAEFKAFMLRNPVHNATQNAPCFSSNTINTIRAEYTNSGANHGEGGWPRDVNVNDPEATQRYRRKVEKDDAYIHAVMNSAPGMEHYVLQNNAIDMYRTYYTELDEIPKPEACDCRTVNVYRDPPSFGSRRPVSSLCWEPDEGERFATSYVAVDADRRPRGSVESFVWNVRDPTVPEVALRSASPVLDLRYGPRDGAVLAGGRMDGVVCAWDLRAGLAPVAACPPHVAHRDLVRSVVFIAAKTGVEFFSAGAEGVVKWWDTRNLDEPYEQIVLHSTKTAAEEPSVAEANGCSALEFEPTIPTRYMVGTENGLVLGGNRKGKTHFEKIPFRYATHVGPVWALERNPAFLKNFLTVGDWTARVWSEDCRESAVLWSPPQRHKITHGAWSPTRVSLMLLTQWNGQLSLWDSLRRQYEPVLTMQVCAGPLLKLKMHEKGKLIVCGGRDGNVYMLELSSNLADSGKNDKGLMTAMLERESKRERILEARMREFRLKLRQAEEGSPAHSLTDVDPSAGDRDLADATAEFNALVKRELAAL